MDDTEPAIRKAYREAIARRELPMNETELLECHEMLTTRVGQNTAVFALYGSAAQQAQHLETALFDFLSAYNKNRAERISFEAIQGHDQKLAKKTLGYLLRELAKNVMLGDPKVSEFLESALVERNFLIHHFFRMREDKLDSADGRMDLLAELSAINSDLEEAAAIIVGLRISFQRCFGTEGGGESPEGGGLLSYEINVPS